MCRIQDLFRKEVINLRGGERLGYICDVEVDVISGCLLSIIVPEHQKGFSIFSKGQDFIIPWCEIKRIGDDLVLVDIDFKCREKLRER